mmetsp:Transcript_113914/g.302709  ORF Transcript_113914/g.302709 Transcript_113914/m.302709 type:complete len:306 (-) Transcript_113914:92-1009(-)
MLRRMLGGGAKSPAEKDQGHLASRSLIGRPSQASLSGASTSASSGQSSPGYSPGAAYGSACAAAEDSSVLTVVCSSLWSEAGTEELWKVEVRSSANVAELKARIAALYDIPTKVQRIQRTADPGDPCFPDTAPVRDFARQPVYLLPIQAALEARGARAEELDGIHLDVGGPDRCAAEQEQMEAMRAMAESLQGVTYNVTIIRPRDPMGAFKEASVKLRLDALALVGNVQAIVEAEMLGPEAGQRQWCLLCNGQALPPNIPLHFAGIGEGATLILVPGGPPCAEEDGYDSDSDSLDDAILNWANGS